MRIVFTIHTPGQEHFWHYIILMLKNKGHDILVLARDDGLTCELLESHGIDSTTYGKASKTSIKKILRLPEQFFQSLKIIKRFKPDLVAGVGILEAHASSLLRKPCIIFEDTEITPALERQQWQKTASSIITPVYFMKDLGKKQIRIEGYKELAYLHPNYFKPDPSIFEELKIKPTEKYTILRFNAFDAVHDIRRRGFSASDKIRLVEELGKFVRVFICPEAVLPPGLESYRLPIAYDRIHHALHYAHLFISDTGTMSTEASILGTPTIMCLSTAGQFGNFVELENKYNLMYAFAQPEKAIEKAIDLVQQPDLKKLWTQKRQKLLAEKIDVTQFMVDFIERYPKSLERSRRTYEKNPDI